MWSVWAGGCSYRTVVVTHADLLHPYDILGYPEGMGFGQYTKQQMHDGISKLTKK